MSLWKMAVLTGVDGICNDKDSEWCCCNLMFVCFIHILLFLSFNARWVRWVWLPTSPTILTDGTLDDLVPTPVPALTYTTAMSHLPSSSVRDHMKWVCFENTKVVTNNFTCTLVSLRMLSLMTSLANAMWLARLSEIQIISNCFWMFDIVGNVLLFILFLCRRGCLAAKRSSPVWPWCRPAPWPLRPKKWWLHLAMDLRRERDLTVLPRAIWSSHLEWAVHPWLGPTWEIQSRNGAVICYAFNVVRGETHWLYGIENFSVRGPFLWMQSWWFILL